MANRRDTPDEVKIRTSPREPVTDPTLGIEVRRGAAAPAEHRLVTIGDSLTHGFMSAAVHRTDLSWPAITAYELGLTAEQFTFPTYEWPTGPGGLPLDLERLARAFESGSAPAGLLGDRRGRAVAALLHGPASRTTGSAATARSPRSRARRSTTRRSTAGTSSTRCCSPRPGRRPARPPDQDDVAAQLVEHHQDRAAWPVLQRARQGNRGRTVLDAVTAMSRAAARASRPWWSSSAPTTPSARSSRSSPRGRPRVRRPARWRSVWTRAWAATCGGRAPSPPTGPRSRASCAGSPRSTSSSRRSRRSRSRRSPGAPTRRSGRDSRYFPYYTRPWITDDDFDTERDPHLTGDEARASTRRSTPTTRR